MPYTPTLLIKVEDLYRREELFESLQIHLPDEKSLGGEEKRKALKYLVELYFEDKDYIVDIFGNKCRVCEPEFSDLNRLVREKLDELEVSYAYFQ